MCALVSEDALLLPERKILDLGAAPGRLCSFFEMCRALPTSVGGLTAPTRVNLI